jgi:aldehyde dehydrogenase (NAD+)
MPETPNRDNAALHSLFSRQMQYRETAARSSASERIRLLTALEKALLHWRPRIHEALHKDFGKPTQEVDLVDIYFVLREIRHTRRHLRRWMHPKRVPTPLAFIGSRASYFHEAKGVTLIISPWNYPVNLTLGPLISALAAGCTAILKPSEHTPHATALLKEMLGTLYPEDLVAVVPGGISTAQHLLTLPFHHIFFTGSTVVGRIVMEAAAKTLASVTLEMGGKCPAIVDASADIRRTAQRLIQTKFTNAGQTCIAPDYILVHQSRYDEMLSQLTDQLSTFYPSEAHYHHSYSGIVHEQHLAKMQAFLQDARRLGARIHTGGEVLAGSRKLLPTIVSGVTPEMTLVQEEIFGPILPVVPYSKVDEVREITQRLDRPLGLYVFAKGRMARKLLQQAVAGGSCINHCALNYYNPHLPFGGVNHSGIGKSHGYAGFQEFSNVRSVYRQVWKYSPIDWLHPPYTRAKQLLIEFTLRWL